MYCNSLLSPCAGLTRAEGPRPGLSKWGWAGRGGLLTRQPPQPRPRAAKLDGHREKERKQGLPWDVCPGQLSGTWSFLGHRLSSGKMVVVLYEGTLQCPCTSWMGTLGQSLAQNLSSESASDTGNGCVLSFSKTATASIAVKFLFQFLSFWDLNWKGKATNLTYKG